MGTWGGIAGQNKSGTASDDRGIVGSTNFGDYYYYYTHANRSVGGLVGNNSGAIKKSATYGRFYLDNKNSSGKRALPEGSAIAPHLGKMIGHQVGYYDNYGNYGSYEYFEYQVFNGAWGMDPFDQSIYMWKHTNGAIGRLG